MGMDDFRHTFRQTTVIADLGPLPEVSESNSETTWRMFQELQSQHGSQFLRTEPSSLAPLAGGGEPAPARLTVDDVMFEARRGNRVCPKEAQWCLLQQLLETGGPDAPAALAGPEFRRTPSLVKRTRVREQVEWAARCGILHLVFGFFRSLPEDDWVHIGA